MIFQTLDDKNECVGIFTNGELNFSSIPEGLSKTWKYTGSINDLNILYAWIWSGGKEIEECCPDTLLQEYKEIDKKFYAYVKSINTSKISLRENCFFDLVPRKFLIQYCDIKNKITEHVFLSYKKPDNYELMSETYKVLHDIKYRKLNLDTSECKTLTVLSKTKDKVRALLDGPRHIEYNMYGSSTGRLTLDSKSFPILNLSKNFRQIIKPNNEWFLSLDYNGADVRTAIALTGKKQPAYDVHDWNVEHIFEKKINREEAKKAFFAWLYNPQSSAISSNIYDRDIILDSYYKDGIVTNPFNRRIEVDKDKALSYLIQSTTNDIVFDRLVAINKILKKTDSYISFIMHDEIVIDLSKHDYKHVKEIKKVFSETPFGVFKTNIKAGKNYLAMEELSI